MWLAVQYWEVFYNDYDERPPGKSDRNKNKRVTFNEVKEVREIENGREWKNLTKITK